MGRIWPPTDNFGPPPHWYVCRRAALDSGLHAALISFCHYKQKCLRLWIYEHLQHMVLKRQNDEHVLMLFLCRMKVERQYGAHVITGLTKSQTAHWRVQCGPSSVRHCLIETPAKLVSRILYCACEMNICWFNNCYVTINHLNRLNYRKLDDTLVCQKAQFWRSVLLQNISMFSA